MSGSVPEPPLGEEASPLAQCQPAEPGGQGCGLSAAQGPTGAPLEGWGLQAGPLLEPWPRSQWPAYPQCPGAACGDGKGCGTHIHVSVFQATTAAVIFHKKRLYCRQPGEGSTDLALSSGQGPHLTALSSGGMARVWPPGTRLSPGQQAEQPQGAGLARGPLFHIPPARACWLLYSWAQPRASVFQVPLGMGQTWVQPRLGWVELVSQGHLTGCKPCYRGSYGLAFAMWPHHGRP